MHFVKFKADEALAKHVLTTEGFPRSKELPPCICLKVTCLKRAGQDSCSTQFSSVEPEDIISKTKLFDQLVCSANRD